MLQINAKCKKLLNIMLNLELIRKIAPLLNVRFWEDLLKPINESAFDKNSAKSPKLASKALNLIFTTELKHLSMSK